VGYHRNYHSLIDYSDLPATLYGDMYRVIPRAASAASMILHVQHGFRCLRREPPTRYANDHVSVGFA
jgi:hypothetical protein